MSRALRWAAATALVFSLAIFGYGCFTLGASDAWAILAGLAPPSGDGTVRMVGVLLSVFGYLLVPALVGSFAAWLWAKLQLSGSKSREVADEEIRHSTIGSTE